MRIAILQRLRFHGRNSYDSLYNLVINWNNDSLGYLWSKDGEDTEIRIVNSIGILILAMLFGVIIALGYTPTIEDYINGRVETKVVTTIKDGEVIKCDTLYYKK